MIHDTVTRPQFSMNNTGRYSGWFANDRLTDESYRSLYCCSDGVSGLGAAVTCLARNLSRP